VFRLASVQKVGCNMEKRSFVGVLKSSQNTLWVVNIKVRYFN
jgi:hypothetical protein